MDARKFFNEKHWFFYQLIIFIFHLTFNLLCSRNWWYDKPSPSGFSCFFLQFKNYLYARNRIGPWTSAVQSTVGTVPEHQIVLFGTLAMIAGSENWEQCTELRGRLGDWTGQKCDVFRVLGVEFLSIKTQIIWCTACMSREATITPVPCIFWCGSRTHYNRTFYRARHGFLE